MQEYIGELSSSSRKEHFSVEAQTDQDLMEDWVVAVLAGQKSEREEQIKQAELARLETIPKPEVQKLIDDAIQNEISKQEQKKVSKQF